ncbi:MAG: tetratricopeptide repeat protein [Acidobacteriaceae bacterium]
MQSSPSRFLIALSLSGLCFAPSLQAQAPDASAKTAKQSAPAVSNPDSQISPQAEAKVIANLQARNYAAALTGAKAILTDHPTSSKANKLVGVIFLDQQKPSDALPYFQKALQLAPNDAGVHGLLLQAYAESGDKAGRDKQRAILRRYHSDGKHPEFAQIPSYLIETIPVGNKIIQAAEFYQPTGEFHFYYRFNIFDSAGHIQSFIALESDDADQVLYAQQNPKQAAAGQRRFSLDGYSKSADGHVIQALYTFYDGKPTYDNVRALVIKLVQSGKSPVAATSTSADR